MVDSKDSNFDFLNNSRDTCHSPSLVAPLDITSDVDGQYKIVMPSTSIGT